MARTKQVPRIRPEHAANNTITASDPRNIPRLPEELLQLIISHIHTPSDFDIYNDEEKIYRSTLLSLCLTNKVFLRLAREVLYHSIHDDFGHNVMLPLSRLFVHEQPGLRDLVRTLKVEGWDIEDLDPVSGKDIRKPLDASLRGVYAKAVEMPMAKSLVDSNVKTPEDFLEDLMAGREDAHLALLILKCEKLEVLSLVLPHGFSKKWNWTSRVLMHAAVSSAGHLPCLREIHVQHWDTEYCVMISDIWSLLRLDSLKVFNGQTIDFEQEHTVGDHGEDLEVALPSHHFKLQEVHLELSIIDAHGLKNLLSCCPDLETLFIHWGSVLQGDCTIWWDQFGTVLRNCPSAAKLRSVTFDIIEMDYYNTGEGCDTSIHPSLGNLTAMSSLQNLDVPAVALWGSDGDGLVNASLHSIVHTLPPTLKRLGVSCWNDCSTINRQVFDERAESEMGMIEVLTADDRRLKDLEALKVAGEGPMYEGSNLLRKWDVVMKRKAHGYVETKRRMPIEEI